VNHLPPVGTGVQIDLSLAQIRGDRISGNEDGSGLECAQILLQLEEVGLVPHAPAIDSVLDSRNFLPGETVIGRSVDREVWLRRRVILPGSKQDAIILQAQPVSKAAID
jgi:hypothetical protein